MTTLQKALEIALAAHAGQTEKPANTPYIQHPLRVMHAVDGLDAKIVAVLHDVLEDTDIAEEDLRRAGFADHVVQGILAVTRQAGETYADFILRAKAHPLARAVKLADLLDNFNLPRTLFREDRLAHDMARLARYALSYQYLTDQIDEESYLRQMSRAERMLSAEAV